MAKRRILLVDDETGFTTLLKLVLTGFEVCAENNPLHAMETARKFKPDIIFLDVIMPDLDGGAVAALLKEDPDFCHIPIVFLTAIVSGSEAASQKTIGGYPFLAKPVGRDQIIAAVEKYLGT